MYLEGQYAFVMPTTSNGQVLPFFMSNQPYMESPSHSFNLIQCSEE